MKNKKNIGTIDRAVRILVGTALLALVALAITGQRSEWALLGLVGVFPLLAGIIGYCLPYALLDINTYNRESKTVEEQAENCSETSCC